MKTNKKTLILRTLSLLLTLAILIIISAFANPKYLDDRINIYGEHATSKFRPILDSSLVCSRYKTWFYIVEQMPRPKITTYEIENILKNEVRFNDQELSSNDTIYFQCVVNCIGKAGDYQILKCPNELVNIGCQVRNVLKIHFTDWEPPVQRGENVDLLALLVVIINNGHFEVVGHWNYGNHN